MKLCLLNYEYPPIGAGAATATEALARAMVRLGHEAVVVTSAWNDLSGWSEDGGLKVLRLKTGRRRADACSITEMAAFTASAAWHLPSIIKERRCAGIIAFFSIPCGPAAWWAASRAGVPYVVSLRGGDVPGTEARIGWMHRVLTLPRRFVLRRARAVIANSEGLRTLSLAADPIPVRVIPNGVDTERFTPAAALRDDGMFRILAVGRLQEQKNHSFALGVIAALVNAIPQRVEYHIVGDGPLRAALEKQAADLGIAGNIVWHGWMKREQIAAMYSSCDCLLQPSLYEGMPNSVLEAMAAALPVVASAIAGNVDVIRDGETGWLLPLNDAPAFAERLRQLATSETLRAQIARASREHVLASFSWDAAARDYIGLFAPDA